MRRRTAKHLKQELNELDYMDRLLPEDKAWMLQFMYEYYQADFNYPKNIHSKESRKDCQRRNTAARSQLHSVGEDLIIQSALKALKIQASKKKYKNLKHRYYTHLDYEPKFQEPFDVEETDQTL